MAQPRDADQRVDEGVPAGAALRQDAPAAGGDAVVALAALACALDPSPLDQPPGLHAIEERVERGGVECEDAVRALLDQLGDLVSVPRPLFEQREHEHFSAALLER